MVLSPLGAMSGYACGQPDLPGGYRPQADRISEVQFDTGGSVRWPSSDGYYCETLRLTTRDSSAARRLRPAAALTTQVAPPHPGHHVWSDPGAPGRGSDGQSRNEPGATRKRQRETRKYQDEDQGGPGSGAAASTREGKFPHGREPRSLQPVAPRLARRITEFRVGPSRPPRSGRRRWTCSRRTSRAE